METIDFVNYLKKVIIDDNNQIYKELFETTHLEDVTDDYWESALKLFQNMSSGQRETLMKIIKQVQIDTLSNILYVLDNGIGLEEIILSTKSEPQTKFNGNLQDIFIEKIS
mgnify:CR=1 FL=1